MENDFKKNVYKRWWFWAVIVLILFLIIVSLNGSGSKPPAQQKITGASLITAFGATLSDWNANHVADMRFAQNAAYNPDSNLPDQTHNDRYLLSDTNRGRVLGYEMRLSGTPDTSTAKSESMKEFPSDAAILWSIQKSGCYQMEVTSKMLGEALADPRIGDSQGAVLVEFQTSAVNGTDAPYDQTLNNDIFFNLGLYQTSADAPSC
jgi:hypothetical protein